MSGKLAIAAGLIGAAVLTGNISAAEVPPQLQGAWAESELSCDQVFSNEGGKWTLKKSDDFNVGGFIVEGDRIRGQSSACTIRSAKRKGAQVKLLLSCENNVLSATQEMLLTLMKDGTIQRQLAGFTDFAQSYKRCN